MKTYVFQPMVLQDDEELVGSVMLTRKGEVATGMYFVRVANHLDPNEHYRVAEIVRDMLTDSTVKDMAPITDDDKAKGA